MRLGKQMELVEQNVSSSSSLLLCWRYLSQYRDREASELWQRLQRHIPAMFQGITVEPSLLHGDLWSGNAGEADGQPGIYSPPSPPLWVSVFIHLPLTHSCL